ncbi:MAG: cupin domain-containing protein [Burkholderiaceae bacterium]
MDTMDSQVQRLIRQFGLSPHPEGGHYAETYRSGERVVRGASGTQRSASTAIYYLLHDGAYSAWHRIASDEVWHFYAGHPLDVHVLMPDGEALTHRLGNALQSPDASFQAVVPAGCWFAAELADPASYAFVGCTVAPGFEFSEFELADADALLAAYPRHASLVQRLISGKATR